MGAVGANSPAGNGVPLMPIPHLFCFTCHCLLTPSLISLRPLLAPRHTRFRFTPSDRSAGCAHLTPTSPASPDAQPRSLPSTFFTAPTDLAALATPIWANRCSNSSDPTAPSYATVHAQLALPTNQGAVVSALAFATAASPVWLLNQAPLVDSGKLLASYRLRINGRVVGVGPGRSRCYAGESEIYGCTPETLYDGYDIRGDVQAAFDLAAAASTPTSTPTSTPSSTPSPTPSSTPTAPTLDVQLSGYGVDQQGWGAEQKMLSALIIRFEHGPAVVLGTDAQRWVGIDRDSYYNPYHGDSCTVIYILFRSQPPPHHTPRTTLHLPDIDTPPPFP